MVDLRSLLTKTAEMGASDLHICAGVPPTLRINGDLLHLEEPAVTVNDCEAIMKQCVKSNLMEELEKKGQVDLALALPGVARFRLNVFRQRSSYALAARNIPAEVPPVESLGLPHIIYKLLGKQRGLILVTGPTGSGKSTTLAAMVDYINIHMKCHIVTIEDPIEFLHKHKNSVINQREVGSDTSAYADALRAVLREDPDVILIGEMRDQETIATALTAAETGHLVFSTLHTVGSAKTIDRVIDVFPPHQQAQVRSQLSTVLQGIISQQLLKKADNSGRVLATEIMTMTPAIANMIRESRIPQINTCIHTGAEHGMHSMDSNLALLFRNGMIDYETAHQHAIDQDVLGKLIMLKN